MTPYEHAILSVRDFGGKPEDYIDIHAWLDQTKAHFPDWKHRAILHNSFGMVLGETIFGHGKKNSSGKLISTREILRRHIVQDLGFVPTIKDWLTDLNNHTRFNRPSKSDLEYLRNFDIEEDLQADTQISLEKEGIY